jgi:nucleoside 2-deoxyribosyltransferase
MENIKPYNSSPMLKFTIYLAGYNKDIEYRKIVKEKYGEHFIILDPMTITFDEVYKDIGKELSDIYLIRRDKKMIDQCDMLIAKIEHLPEGKIMIGTIMEIMYSFMKGIPVFIISSDNCLLENPWLKFHSTGRFNSIDECFDFILNDKLEIIL